MTEIYENGAYTYYMQEDNKGFYGLYVFYSDGKKQTTSNIQLKGNYDFIIKSKNLAYVKKVVKNYVNERYDNAPNLQGHYVFKIN